MRVVDCGNCGMVSERCTGGLWQPQSACLGQGECAAAAVETGALPLCGEQQRLCDTMCAWSDWSVTQPGMGDCNPGEQRLDQADCAAGGYRRQTCSTTCGWETDPGECTDACGGSPRTSPADAVEICIPAGPFIRGAEMINPSEETSIPVREVMLSAYYIDKYPVTFRRFAECVAAGSCTASQPGAAARLDDPAYVDHPVYEVTWDEARAFCEWDGRRMVTEAEWEKAARGPAPSEAWYPWGSEFPRCDLLCTPDCAGCTYPPTSPSEAYDSLPGSASTYGVEMLLGGASQWVWDFLDFPVDGYYALPESLVDPQGPPTGSLHVGRGYWRAGIQQDYRVTSRWSDALAIRCARTGAP